MVMELKSRRSKYKCRIVDHQGKRDSSREKSGIYRLVNHGQYYLRYVFILVEKGQYKLVVIDKGILLTYKYYKSLRCAKMAFARRYENRNWKKGARARWSTFFPPGIKWLKEKIKEAYANTPNNVGCKAETGKHKVFISPSIPALPLQHTKESQLRY